VATYVYCVVASARRPRLPRGRRGVPGLGRPRVIPVSSPSRAPLWIVAADAPLDAFGEAPLNQALSNIDWVSRAAVAHEAVVESFLRADAVLPMKLFTIFTSDERASAHIESRRPDVERVLRRVKQSDEWSVRVRLEAPVAVESSAARPDRLRATGRGGASAARRGGSGAAYLAAKKARLDARAELVERSKRVVTDLFERLAGQAGEARRRSAPDLPVENGPLLLDAAFLVPRVRTTRFRTVLTSEARRLQPKGYRVSLTGPWPPYSFLQDA
jgi:hypothetical protein